MLAVHMSIHKELLFYKELTRGHIHVFVVVQMFILRLYIKFVLKNKVIRPVKQKRTIPVFTRVSNYVITQFMTTIQPSRRLCVTRPHTSDLIVSFRRCHRISHVIPAYRGCHRQPLKRAYFVRFIKITFCII